MRPLFFLMLLGLMLAPRVEAQYTATRVASGLSSPVYVTSPPGDARLFIVEQTGRILIHDGVGVLGTPFLDLGTIVSSGFEQGLLGLAFPDDFATSELFYVNYTDLSGDTVVARYRVSAGDPNVADPVADAAFSLVIAQPAANHNGGHIAFGADDFLYVGMGDGGGADDTFENGQDLTTLHGAMLRIDVSGGFGTDYTVPGTNPFVDGPGGDADEIWSYGLRNPYRFSFDRLTGDLFIGDVGQNTVEEIDFQPAASLGGENYGWNVMEGSDCFEPPSGCDTTGLTLPVLEHLQSTGVSAIIGGYRYRGPSDPLLDGLYFYGDFSGPLFAATEVSPGTFTTQPITVTPDVGSIDVPSGFGEDDAGNVYIVDLTGEVFRLGTEAPPVPVHCAAAPVGGCDEAAGKAVLVLVDKNADGPGAKDRVVYRWVRGPAHTQAFFGDPTLGGGFVSACVYENGSFLFELSIPEADPNWQVLGTKGFKYVDKDGTYENDGALKLVEIGGDAGKSKLVLVGKDGNLAIPSLPRAAGASYVVEVHNPDNASCVGTTFLPSEVLVNKDKVLRLKQP